MLLSKLLENSEDVEDFDFTAKLVGKIATKYGFKVGRRAFEPGYFINQAYVSGVSVKTETDTLASQYLVNLDMSLSKDDTYGALTLDIVQSYGGAGSTEVLTVPNNREMLEPWSVHDVPMKNLGSEAEKMFKKLSDWFKELEDEA